jgi:hypothetical protein
MVGFKVLTAVDMRAVFRDIMPCSPLKGNVHVASRFRLEVSVKQVTRSCFPSIRRLTAWHNVPENGTLFPGAEYP